MKIDFTKPILGLDGKPIKDEKDQEVKLSAPCINSLIANAQDEHIDGVEKMARFVLAQKILQAEEEIDLKAEEVAKIKQLVGKFMPTLVAGAVWIAIETVKE